MEALLAGEIVINNVDRDGTMTGYDEDIIKKIVDVVNIPVIALGGTGSPAAAGSLFVYYGKLKAVLINYLSQEDLRRILKGGAYE